MLMFYSKRNARRWLMLSAAGLAGLATTPGLADTLYWDPGMTDSNSGGGSGTWDTSTPNWFDGNVSAEVVWNNIGQSGSPDDAIFGGSTGGTVTLSTDMTAKTLTFNTTGYTLTSGTLALSGGSSTVVGLIAAGVGSTGTANITVTAGATTTLDTPLVGSTYGTGSDDLLTLGGGGTLILTQQSSYAGATSILSGTLQLGTNTALPTSTGIVMGTPGSSTTTASLNLGNFSQTVYSLATATNKSAATNTITINSGSTLTVNSYNPTPPSNYYAVDLGGASATGTGTATVNFTGGGNFVINSNNVQGTGVGFEVGSLINTAAQAVTVDMRNLSSFTANGLGSFRVGDASTDSSADASTLFLPPTATISAATVRIGSDTPGVAGSNTNIETLNLGNTANVLNAGDIRVGVGDSSSSNDELAPTSSTNSRANGVIQFNGGTDASPSAGSITIRNSGGSVAGAFLFQIYAEPASSNTLTSKVDLGGHPADVTLEQLIMAWRGGAGAGGATATFTFDPPASGPNSNNDELTILNSAIGAGALSMIIGERTLSEPANAATAVNATANIASDYTGPDNSNRNGAGVTGTPVHIGPIQMATNNATASFSTAVTSTGTLNLSGAGLQAFIYSIQMGDATGTNISTSNLNITGGNITLGTDAILGNPPTGSSAISRAAGGGTENTNLTITGGAVLDMSLDAIGASGATIGMGPGSSLNFGSNTGTGFGANSLPTSLVGTLENLSEFNGGISSANPAYAILTQSTVGGTLILTNNNTTTHNNNTYTGGTAITAGMILANSPAGDSSTGSGPVNIYSGGVLAGIGYIGNVGSTTTSQVNVNAGSGVAGGTISAGNGAASSNATGVLHTSGGDGGATVYSQVWTGGAGGTGGAYDWKVNAAQSTGPLVTDATNGVGTTDPSGTAGTNWDTLAISTLNVAASSGSPFNIQVVPTGTSASSFNSANSYTWTIADVTSGTVNVNGTTYQGNSAPVLASLQAALRSALALNTSALSAPSGNFSIVTAADRGSGDDIEISYSSAPEPGSLALLGLGLGGLMLRRRRGIRVAGGNSSL
jgi:fibronectin-binding autotransporter adhesin